jgi:hypothetical protein
MRDSFVSVVVDRERPSNLLVRARREGDVQNLLTGFQPGLRVVQTDHADYRFRASVSRPVFERAFKAQAAAIDYSNFKDAVDEDDGYRHDVYSRVWGAALSLDARRPLRNWPEDLFDDEPEQDDEDDSGAKGGAVPR